jgi:type II secretory pathway component PulM
MLASHMGAMATCQVCGNIDCESLLTSSTLFGVDMRRREEQGPAWEVPVGAVSFKRMVSSAEEI